MVAPKSTSIRLLLLTLVSGILAIGGCNRRMTDEELAEARLDPVVRALDRVGRIYMGFHDAHGRGPANWGEMKHFAEDDEGGLEAISLVRANGFDMKWRVVYSEVGDQKAPEFILAESDRHDAKLMLNRTVQFY